MAGGRSRQSAVRGVMRETPVNGTQEYGHCRRSWLVGTRSRAINAEKPERRFSKQKSKTMVMVRYSY
jgi:hypothetical protein